MLLCSVCSLAFFFGGAAAGLGLITNARVEPNRVDVLVVDMLVVVVLGVAATLGCAEAEEENTGRPVGARRVDPCPLPGSHRRAEVRMQSLGRTGPRPD